MQQTWGRVKLTEVNPHLVCVLCHGYFIDATTMAECPHSFCRSCIVLYLETKSYCPICEVQIHKTKPHLNLKPDKTLQDIVYKLVPGLFHSEMTRRKQFYAKNPNRDLYLSPEARGVGVERIIYSPEDNMSLSLEYYDDDREREEWASAKPGTYNSANSTSNSTEPPPKTQKSPLVTDGLKRYLNCPAVVTMSHLKKFTRLKYGLSQACSVEILYRRESLPDSYSLMDIAYIYTWKRNGPMRFYYRIHVPTPLREILPPLKASSEPILDTTPPRNVKLPSPELLDAVGLQRKPPEEPIQEPIPKLKIRLDEGKKAAKEGDPTPSPDEPKNEKECPKISTAEDSAVSLLLALSNGHATSPTKQPEPETESKSVTGSTEPEREREAETPTDSATSSNTDSVKPPQSQLRPPPPLAPSTGGFFKVPQSMTKRFIFNGGKLMAVKSKPSGKQGKPAEKTKVNGKITNGMSPLVADRLRDPLNLGNSYLPMKSGSLPPGSPRPPPNSEKVVKTKYMPPSGLLLNRLTPEVTLSENKTVPEPAKGFSKFPPPSAKQSQPQTKGINVSKFELFNGQPKHRKEVNRLEQIVNCIKKESEKLAAESKTVTVRNEPCSAKRNGALSASANTRCEEAARATAGDSSIQPADHVAANPSKPDQLDTAEHKDSADSILKRKLNEPSYNRLPFGPAHGDSQNGFGDAKKRRLVTPDVSIELMANPAKEKLLKDKKRPPSDLSTLTKRFLSDIERIKDTEMKTNKLDTSMVRIEKVPAPTSQSVSSSKLNPSRTEPSIDGNEFSSENDQLFIDIRNKCEALKRKSPEPVSTAIDRTTEDPIAKSTNSSNDDKEEVPSNESETPTSSSSETSSKPSGTHKKLPRLIEINAPPRPRLTALTPDPRQKTGLKMTTVRKEVPLVRKDSNGALDLSSGLSPPSAKNGSKSPFHRPSDKGPSPSQSSLSSLMAMTSFPSPDSSKSPPIRIPTLKPKSSPTPRPSSLSSSSPSPPADRSPTDVFPSAAAYQQLYRHQMELQSRFLASQVNNNWSRDILTSKKFEDWMRNVMNLPPHPLMFPSQLSPENSRK